MNDEDKVLAQPGAKRFVKDEPLIRRRKVTEEDIVAKTGGTEFFPNQEPLTCHSLMDEAKYGSPAAASNALREACKAADAKAERREEIRARMMGTLFVLIPLALIALLWWWVRR